MTDVNKVDLFDVKGDPKPPSNPAEQNERLNMPELSPQQKLVDEMSLGMKPSRSDSSSETFVADQNEALRHDQVQRIQEGTVQSSDAPNDPKVQERAKDVLFGEGSGSGGDTTILGGGVGADPDNRTPVNPGGLTDLSTEGIRHSTETSVVRQLGVAETDDNKDAPFEAYIAGRKTTVTKEEHDRYQQLLKEADELLRGRPLDNVPLGHPYWAKKGELEAFAASL